MAVFADVRRVILGDRIRDVVVLHARLLASADIDGSVRVAVDNFAWDEEVVLADLRSTLADTTREVAERVDSYLHGLVHAEPVDIEAFNPHTGEMNNLVKDTRSPVSKAVLNSTELGQLFLPLWVDTKCSSVAKLIEFAVHTANHFGRVFVVVEVASLVPETRKFPRAVFVKCVGLLKVSVNAGRFVADFMLGPGERRSGVLESVECVDVGHGGKCIFDNDPDSLVMDLLNCIAYFGKSSMVVIQNSQVVRAEAISSPRLIQE